MLLLVVESPQKLLERCRVEGRRIRKVYAGHCLAVLLLFCETHTAKIIWVKKCRRDFIKGTNPFTIGTVGAVDTDVTRQRESCLSKWSDAPATTP